MRHPQYGKQLEETCATFACQFVEATGDLMSLTNAVYETVKKWQERHADKAENAGD